ncbi:MAG: ABC transporter substrate-binding protein [Thermomicrobiales bacterium]|nr:ABC transporter substrate-binding protein [Thermomicrobiales bacterium]
MNQREVLEVLSEKLNNGSITRRQFSQAAALFGLGAAVKPLAASAAPAGGAIAAPLRAQAEGEVRFLIAEAFWADWHQYNSTAQSQRRVGQQLFDSLIQIESADFAAFTPGLAESWEQIDELTWKFVLRQGVTFHNGQAFGPADVKASIELATGATAEVTVTASRFVPVTVEIVDDVTVQLKTETPFAPMLNELSRLPILSAEDIQPSDDPATPSAGAGTLAGFPNGTGPFRLIDDQQNVKTMEANPDYWNGAPQIGTLVWEYIQDGQTRLNAFLAGQAQAIDRVPPEHLPVIEGTDGLSAISVTGFEDVNLWMRQDSGEPWDNVKLREAVILGIDRQALVESLVGGASEVAISNIPNGAVFATQQEPAWALDLEAAQAALAEAGFADGGPDLPLWGISGFLPRGEEVCEAIADSLAQVGFNVQLQITDIAGLIDGLFAEDKPGLFFHVSWSSNGDPHGALSTLYKSPGAWVGINDATVDSLIDAGAAATDDAERAGIYEELQAYLWSNVIHIPLYKSDFTVAHADSVQGITVLPNFDTIFRSATLAG